MNCLEVSNLLSAYYDGELPDDQRRRVSEHLDRCTDCSRELHGFERLSRMANTLGNPAPPEYLWRRIETELDQSLGTDQLPQRAADSVSRWSFASPRIVTLAAAILGVIGIIWLADQARSPHGEHEQFVEDFGSYLAEFQRSPDAAQRLLLAKYENHIVAPDEAIERVGYRPVVADGLPPDYVVQSTYVMKMPCCTCVQALCHRSDGSTLAIFEHNDDDARWFGNRPSTTVSCNGRQCSLVELEDSIAASWKRGDRFITLIGVRDIAEINQMVAWLDER